MVMRIWFVALRRSVVTQGPHAACALRTHSTANIFATGQWTAATGFYMTLPTQSSVLAGTSIYGNPRGRNPSLASVKWEAANLALLEVPFALFYDGKPCRGVRLHKAAHKPFAKFYELIWDAAKKKQETIDLWGMSIFGGGYNYRLMRGGAALSMHSFGCAVDHDPARNGLGDKTPRFLEFSELMKAIRASGLCWGGDWDGDGNSTEHRSCDGMHFQATLKIG